MLSEVFNYPRPFYASIIVLTDRSLIQLFSCRHLPLRLSLLLFEFICRTFNVVDLFSGSFFGFSLWLFRACGSGLSLKDFFSNVISGKTVLTQLRWNLFPNPMPMRRLQKCCRRHLFCGCVLLFLLSLNWRTAVVDFFWLVFVFPVIIFAFTFTCFYSLYLPYLSGPELPFF